MTETGEISDHKLQMLVLERRNAGRNMARFYVLAIEPTLFGEMALVREWGRIGSWVVVASTSILTGPLRRNSTLGWVEKPVADIRSGCHISCPDRRQASMLPLEAPDTSPQSAEGLCKNDPRTEGTTESHLSGRSPRGLLRDFRARSEDRRRQVFAVSGRRSSSLSDLAGEVRCLEETGEI